MKRSRFFVLLTVVAAAAAFPPSGASAYKRQLDAPTLGGLATDNVEHIRHVPLAQDGTGGRLIGDYFYMNDSNKIMIWDVADPENPSMTGYVLMPQEWTSAREDLDGNGEILVVPNTTSGVSDGSPSLSPMNAVYIIDVEDKTNPQIISKVPGAAEHTFSCVLDCKYAWGSGGTIIDLRNPAEPKLLDQKWGDRTPAGNNAHDVEEVAPGIVMTATDPMMLLDARKDPLHPKLIALSEPANQFIHGSRWPRDMKDDFLLAASETTLNGRCSDSSGSFQVWDARNWKKTKTFRLLEEFRVRNGAIVDGNPPAQRNCTAHWLEEHPDFRNGGYVAVAYFDHGTRFFEVTAAGEIKEAGYFYAYAGRASATYWITDEIVYTVDYSRGLDILRFTPPSAETS